MSRSPISLFSLLLGIPTLVTCGGAASREAPRSADGRPLTEQEAYERARPVFERYCASCHTSDRGKKAALRHFRMDGYPFEGPHAAEIGAEIREVLGTTGEPATMPKDRPGAVQGDDLRRLLDWANAFDRAHPSGEHHHEHGDDHDGHKHGDEHPRDDEHDHHEAHEDGGAHEHGGNDDQTDDHPH